MAWFGTITDVQRRNETWLIDVDYFDDANPEMKIARTVGPLPLSITRAEVVQAIRNVGREVRATIALTSETIVGVTISIP